MPFHLDDTGWFCRDGPWPTTAAGRQRDVEAKWRAIIRFGSKYTYGGGASSCAFCHVFGLKRCRGCPVKKRTRKPACLGTPYYAWAADHSVTSAKAELAFLKTLRPKRRAKK